MGTLPAGSTQLGEAVRYFLDATRCLLPEGVALPVDANDAKKLARDKTFQEQAHQGLEILTTAARLVLKAHPGSLGVHQALRSTLALCRDLAGQAAPTNAIDETVCVVVVNDKGAGRPAQLRMRASEPLAAAATCHFVSPPSLFQQHDAAFDKSLRDAVSVADGLLSSPSAHCDVQWDLSAADRGDPLIKVGGPSASGAFALTSAVIRAKWAGRLPK